MLKILLLSTILLAAAVYFFFQNNTPELLNKTEVRTEKNILAKMTLEEKVGQLLIIGFDGTEIDENIRKVLETQKPGGIILFEKNLKNESQTKKLISDLQDIANNYPNKTPLFISVDQEGGKVSRINFDNKYEVTPQNTITSTDQAYELAKRRGVELKNLGINMNYSPVVDYIPENKSFLYSRVFSTSQQEISRFGLAMITGYQEEKVIAVPKHFPGHTGAAIDPHKGLPEVDGDKANLEEKMAQFKNLARDKNTKVLMVGHILYSNIDATSPTSLSKIFIEDILVNQLGYKGLVITDDLQMGAILGKYSPEDISVKAFDAGNDILLFSKTDETQVKAYNSLLRAVKSGRISEDQLDESVAKILRLKKEFL